MLRVIAVGYLRQVMTQPPRVVMKKAQAIMRRRLRLLKERHKDRTRKTYQDFSSPGETYLNDYFPTVPVASLLPHASDISRMADQALHHQFDLLGSGKSHVRYGQACPGMHGERYDSGASVYTDPAGQWLKGRINPSNFEHASRVWQLISPEYSPIDWQLDFKSGYRWTETTRYHDIVYGVLPGVDVKVPWELARMQHLVQLAFAYALSDMGKAGFKSKEFYLDEFRHQILDFIATNPPRYGVNWNCIMDVAIRVANWLVARDLFRGYGAVFNREFERLFINSVYDHGCHISANLEYNETLRGNHYLANIVGLLFAAAYLPSTKETDTWLALAGQEFVKEFLLQFHDEGSNFEASTAYHRLSGEMAIYGAALILGLPASKIDVFKNYDLGKWQYAPQLNPAPLPTYCLAGTESQTILPDSMLKRLRRMADFSLSVSPRSDHAVQVGDNDNGRFLKLQPSFLPPDATGRVDENHLDHTPLIAAVGGLFQGDVSGLDGQNPRFESGIVKGLAGLSFEKEIHLYNDPGKANQLEGWCSFHDFGLYIFRKKALFLAVRCGNNGQNNHGGHAHNDQLSFILYWNGRPVFIDPGTFIYTPLPTERNRFRSTRFHNTVAVEGLEQNNFLLETLFALQDQSKGRVVQLSANEIIGEHTGFPKKHRRSVRIDGERIRFIDTCNLHNTRLVLNLSPTLSISSNTVGRLVLEDLETGFRFSIISKTGSWHTRKSFYSSGYGEKETCVRLELPFSSPEIQWEILLPERVANER